ncbi:MAG: hypothetical protein WD114_00475 [Phycisphaerales bacterium]
MAELRTDWDEVTGGNWSPWVDAGDGTKEWNPAASYNAWAASVPEEEKAWPVLLEVEYEYIPIIRNEYLGSIPTDGEEWDRLVPVLATEDADTMLARVLVAFNKPVMGVWWSSEDLEPYEHAAKVKHAESQPEPEPGEREVYHPGTLSFDPEANYPILKAVLPSLGRHRDFTNFTRSKSAYELEQGDAALFVASMEGLLKSTDLSIELPLLISVLVETAIESVAIRTIDWGVSTHRERFDAAMLERLDNALAEHADARYVWEGEALMFHDVVRRVSDQNGRLRATGVQSLQDPTGVRSDGLSTPTDLPDTMLHASSQRTLYAHKKILLSASEHSILPWDGKELDADSILEQEREKLNFISFKILNIMLPALDRAAQRVRQHTQEVIGVRVGIAAHRHYERHGAFPESIDAIDDDLIDFDPVDAFTGEPLKYKLTETGPVVYSVGPDRIDNGGRQGWNMNTAWDDSTYRVKKRVEWWSPEEAQALAGNEDAQWDWVLFPVPPDENPPVEEEYDPDWDLKHDGSYEDVYGEEPMPESDG